MSFWTNLQSDTCPVLRIRTAEGAKGNDDGDGEVLNGSARWKQDNHFCVELFSRRLQERHSFAGSPFDLGVGKSFDESSDRGVIKFPVAISHQR